VLAGLGMGALMALVLIAKIFIFRASGSVALLADAVHNLGDALTRCRSRRRC
jgi:divalent metal cation (Fe/Co/Zn/Cd) transporter